VVRVEAFFFAEEPDLKMVKVHCQELPQVQLICMVAILTFRRVLQLMQEEMLVVSLHLDLTQALTA
jgi:hypothetical protein